jgi:hypothetical protein
MHHSKAAGSQEHTFKNILTARKNFLIKKSAWCRELESVSISSEWIATNFLAQGFNF